MRNPCGNQILKNLGPMMPRLMRPTLAAAYAACNLGTFRKIPELAHLIRPYFGIEAVDIRDLDAAIDAEKERLIREEGENHDL